MSLKHMIESWKEGVDLGQNEQYEEAIGKFLDMPEPGARIYFNIASMYLRLGKLSDAEKSLDTCVAKDPHLAIGYFQRGCLHLLNKKNKEAINDFDLSLKNLRGNLLIDYKQLGLIHKLYSCEVMYNRAYALFQLGRKADANGEMENALAIATESSESRHQVIKQALDQMMRGESFLPYKLPKTATFFVPPKTKTNVVQNMDFLGKAKVVSSIVDQDKFAGFVGAQKRKEREEREGKSLSPIPPAVSQLSTSPSLSTEETKGKSRPPKPTMAPPPPRSSSRSPSSSRSSPHRRTPSPSRELDPHSRSPGLRLPSPPPDAITVKIHYTTTRAFRISKSTNLAKLLSLVCKKFDVAEGSLSIWHRIGDTDNLVEIECDEMLNGALTDLEDGFRLTVWAYNKAGSNGDSDGVLMNVVGLSDYAGQYSDELSFKEGNKLQVFNEVNEEWYYGSNGSSTGIFPKCYVK